MTRMLFLLAAGLLATVGAFGTESDAGAVTADLPDGLYAKFDTPRGAFVCVLYADRAPLTVTSFVGLAEGTLAARHGKPFYTGLKWYRVVPDFVIQSGDPTFAPDKPDDDAGQPYTFPDEFSPGLHYAGPGVLGMANAGPDTNSSEFFLSLRDTTRLNYLHTIFGRVVRGLDVLPRIQADDPLTIAILRLGPKARAFRADQAAFDALRARARPYSGDLQPGSGTHFDDPDKLLPAEPPRAQNFNFKLANFERASGVKIVARVFAHSPPGLDDRRLSGYARQLATELGVADGGVLALYVADRGEWKLWIGDALVPAFMGRDGTVKDFMTDGAFHQAKSDFLAAAKQQGEAYAAEAEQRATPEHPVTAADRVKYAVDAVLDALILKFEPR
jgi:cyclophilin family peptidyl-prolyl cis-trans isomerase